MLPSSKFKIAVDTAKVFTPHPCSIGWASTASIHPWPSLILNCAFPSRIESVRGATSTVTSTLSSPVRLGISFVSSEGSSEVIFSCTTSFASSIFSAISSVPPHAIKIDIITSNEIDLNFKYFIILFLS